MEITMNRGQVYSVSAINRFIKDMFSNEYALSVVFVKGEISNCKYHSSGHIYFTLKDAASSLACVMFAGDRRGLEFRLEDGQEVVIGGTVNVYERDGKYQLYAKKVTLAGDGILYEKYGQLKKKLERKGFFDENRKKPIPKYVKRVGIVTAQTGAAIQDMLQISARRNPYVQLMLYPAKVQGEGASDTIVEGIRYLDKLGVDVIIVGRGGGSIEDLWAFNEEKTAIAIYECSTPIVSAVGHETDTTIADYVADLRAPTPSAAAELAVTDVHEILGAVSAYRDALWRQLRRKIEERQGQLRQLDLRMKIVSPGYRIGRKKMDAISAEERLREGMRRLVEKRRHSLEIYVERLRGLSPLDRLCSGYSYIEDAEGKNIRSVRQVQAGQEIHIMVSDGVIDARVTAYEALEMKPNSDFRARED